MIVGERLKAVRESKKLSQGYIENKTGLLRCYVSRVENGHTTPSIETLEKWTRALDISMSQLFAENGGAAKPLTALKSSQTPKLNRTAMNSLRRVEAAFARMKPRDIAIITSLSVAKRVQFGRFTPNWLDRGPARQQTMPSPIIPTD
jgi:transcriptional regulator with XRE-family HTH domain